MFLGKIFQELMIFGHFDQVKYSPNSTYDVNLNDVLSTISSKEDIKNGFYSFSNGTDSDKVYAIGFCRVDINQDSLLTQLYPNQKEAIGWYDSCMLRFSDRSIYGISECNPRVYMWNANDVSDKDGYIKVLQTLFDSMKSEAASGASLKFAGRTSLARDLSTLYVLAQCTPELSNVDCSDCLTEIYRSFPQAVGKEGGGTYTPSCNYRFETFPFFNLDYAKSSPPFSVSPLPPPPVKGTIILKYVAPGLRSATTTKRSFLNQPINCIIELHHFTFLPFKISFC